VSEGLLRSQVHLDIEQSGSSFGSPQVGSEGLRSADGDQRSLPGETGHNGANYDETRQLLHSGAHAAARLAGLSEREQQQALARSHELAAYWMLYKQGGSADEGHWLSSSIEALPPGWQALRHWLGHQRNANGPDAGLHATVLVLPILSSFRYTPKHENNVHRYYTSIHCYAALRALM
jgi:hypothetical protein